MMLGPARRDRAAKRRLASSAVLGWWADSWRTIHQFGVVGLWPWHRQPNALYEWL